MSMNRTRRLRALCLAGSMVLTASLAGCEPGNPNAAEYYEHTPPGKPPENPNESNSQRRSRTLKVGGKQAAAAKGADGKKKSP